MDVSQLQSLAAVILAASGVGVSWGVIRTWVQAMKEGNAKFEARMEGEIDDLKAAREKHGDAIAGLQSSITGIEVNVSLMLQAQGRQLEEAQRRHEVTQSKLDRMLGQRGEMKS